MFIIIDYISFDIFNINIIHFGLLSLEQYLSVLVLMLEKYLEYMHRFKEVGV